MSDAFVEIGDHWKDDSFDRKPYAEFLSNYLRGKSFDSLGNHKPFAMALDAGWGSGKTFFLERWAEDLKVGRGKSPRHKVVLFDAWAADYAEDPLIAFMSELRSELQNALKESGIKTSAKGKARNAINAATDKLRYIAMPIASMVAKSIIKKTTSIDIDGIARVIGTREDESDSKEREKSSPASDEEPTKAIDSALDNLFKAQLDEHFKRKKAVKEFRGELQVALEILQSEEGVESPLFVLIDELDRCKPSFAVGLLESIKHIFGIPGVCIVVATNMEQLAHTIKAVYGEGFDARTYLRRFFDATYSLPLASGPKQLDHWIKECAIFADSRCCWALIGRGFDPDIHGPGNAGMLAWIFAGLNMSLRDQRQTLELMEATALGIPKNRRIHIPWVALTCALWHSYREQFEILETACKRNNNGDKVWTHLGLNRFTRRYTIYQYHPKRGNHTYEFSLTHLAEVYASAVSTDLIKLQENYNGQENTPQALALGEIARDAPKPYDPQESYPTGLGDYFTLVRTAGHLQRFDQRPLD